MSKINAILEGLNQNRESINEDKELFTKIKSDLYNIGISSTYNKPTDMPKVADRIAKDVSNMSDGETIRVQTRSIDGKVDWNLKKSGSKFTVIRYEGSNKFDDGQFSVSQVKDFLKKYSNIAYCISLYEKGAFDSPYYWEIR